MSKSSDIDPATIEERNSRSFSHFLTTVENGVLNADLSKAQQEVVAALNDRSAQTGAAVKGEITLKLGFTLDRGVMEITSDYKLNLPKVKRGKTIYFTTPDNRLTRQDPSQRAFEFRDVNAEDRRDVRTV